MGPKHSKATDWARLKRWLDARLSGEAAAGTDDASAQRLLGFAKAPLAALDTPPIHDTRFSTELAADLADAGDFAPGDEIGPFRIERVIGAGGMGTVYLALRVTGGFEQRVALKILTGARADAGSLRQFEREREVLARLEHPRIARLIDGGTTDEGRPWFAMEFVEGEPIDCYVDAHSLSVDARIALFVQVCRALDYAHGQLVMHRDIKPSNILVTLDGQAKLLDFGLGRILQPVTAGATETQGSRWFTPQYASPEQVRGEAMTVASEVYQLGVLLYRLLCDRTPFDFTGASTGQIMEAICEIDPRKPSDVWHRRSAQREDAQKAAARLPADTMARRLRGDLDNIALKALAKKPADRYSNVADFIADIQRHVEHRPVRARAATRIYRLGKFVRRYRVAVAATAAAFALVFSGLVVIAWQARIVAAERDTARFQAARWEVLSDQLLSLFRKTSVKPGTGEPGTRELLQDSVDQVDQMLSGDPAGRARVQAMLGALHVTLEDHVAARPLLEAFVASDDGSASAPLRGQAYKDLARVRLRLGEPSAALKAIGKALSILEPLPGNQDRRLSEAWQVRGRIHAAMGEWDDAITAIKRGIEIARSSNPSPNRQLAAGISELAATLTSAGHTAEAMKRYREATTMWRELGLEGSHDALNVNGDLASMAFRQGRLDEAESLFQETIDARQRRYGPSLALALLHRDYGLLLLVRHRPDEARDHLERALALGRRFADTRSPEYAQTLRAMGLLAMSERHPELALDYLRWAEAVFVEALGPDQMQTVITRGHRFAALRHVDPAAAAAGFDETVAALEAAGTAAAPYLADMLCEQACLHLDNGNARQALGPARRCLAIRSEILPAEAWQRTEAGAIVAAVEAQRDVADAHDRLVDKTARLAEVYGPGHPRLEWLKDQ